MALTKAKLMELIGSGDFLLSNPNLLHNWDFRETPVNQRASTGAISSGYFYDRWMRYAGTITINATYLSMPADASIEQRIEGHGLSGKAVTVSILLGDAVISGGGTFPTSAGTAAVTLTGFGTATLGYHADYMFVRITATDSTRNLQAAKLEIGANSTLAYDPPMEYGTELAKCQRYFYLLKPGGQWYVIGTGTGDSATQALVAFTFPAPMRIAPTITKSGTWSFSSIAIGYFYGVHAMLIAQGSYVSGVVTHINTTTDANAYLAFSSDL